MQVDLTFLASPLLPPAKPPKKKQRNLHLEKSTPNSPQFFNSTNPQPPTPNTQKHPHRFPTISLSSPGTDDGDDKDGDNDIEASLDSAVCCQIWWTGRVHLKSEMKHEVEGDQNTN